MQDNKQPTIDEFYAKYTLVKNPLVVNASFDNCMFETYGQELGYILSQVPDRKMWTIIDCDGWYGVVAGYHIVNRLGFLVTEEAWQNEYEQYVITNEEPVNDWFFSLELTDQEKVFPDLEVVPGHSKEDLLEEAWHRHSTEEKEELMNNFKN